MDSLALLTEQLRLHPTEHAIRAMWRDEYQDRNGCSDQVAKRECAHVWVPALNNWYLESAAVLVHEVGEVHSVVRSVIRRYARMSEEPHVTIAVARGWAFPHQPVTEQVWIGAVVDIRYPGPKAPVILHTLRGEPAYRAVLVGARYVLNLAKTIGIVWTYETPAELHQQREEYERTHTPATGPADGDQGEDHHQGD